MDLLVGKDGRVVGWDKSTTKETLGIEEGEEEVGEDTVVGELREGEGENVCEEAGGSGIGGVDTVVEIGDGIGKVGLGRKESS